MLFKVKVKRLYKVYSNAGLESVAYGESGWPDQTTFTGGHGGSPPVLAAPGD